MRVKQARMNEPRLLVIGDSPSLETGFARVVQNLLSRWQHAFEQIDVWGIGFNGCPHPLPYRIWPATFATARGYDWAGNLHRIFPLLEKESYTHAFIIQDPWAFSEEWSDKFAEICRRKGVHTTFYCPVDAPLRRKWVSVLTHVDLPIAYCDYGAREIKTVCGLTPKVLPHGVDTAVYRPLWSTVHERDALRARCFGEQLKPDEILLLSVASHQKRKGLVNTLEIFQRLLKKYKLPVKLMMHMEAVNRDEATNLEIAAEQLGIPMDTWFHSQNAFVEGGFPKVTEKGLNDLYNCADVFLSTTLGEGWGLPHCEAVAAGVPHVFVPNHTSCEGIAYTLHALGCNASQTAKLHLSASGVMLPQDRSRVRYPVDVMGAADAVAFRLENHQPARLALPPRVQQWLSWDRIADEFLELMLGRERL